MRLWSHGIYARYAGKERDEGWVGGARETRERGRE